MMMLGFFLPQRFRLPVLVVLVLVLAAGLTYGVANGVFAHNNREALRLEREAPVAR